MTEKFSELCSRISYNFNNIELLKEAMTHPSFSKESKTKLNYQRLEFLGDKVLSLVIADFLMAKYKTEDEGHLSRRQASLVSGETLSQLALKIGLENCLQISRGEKNLGGKTNKRNLENALEALIGAIYLDSNYDKAKEFILNFWQDLLEKNIEAPKDPVSELQEIVQSASHELPNYTITKTGGSDHSPTFIANVRINYKNLEFQAEGKSKKEAQKEVAKIALQNLIDKK